MSKLFNSALDRFLKYPTSSSISTRSRNFSLLCSRLGVNKPILSAISCLRCSEERDQPVPRLEFFLPAQLPQGWINFATREETIIIAVHKDVLFNAMQVH